MEKHDRPGASRVDPKSSWHWAVLAGFIIRLIVVGFLYKQFLVPDRDHWEFGFEVGRIARSLATGQGFGNLFFAPTGPTAWITPVYPFLLAGIFKAFGVYTKSAALAILTVNSLFSSLTCIPIFSIAHRSFGSLGAKWATWVWALFPYAIFYSTAFIWYHCMITFFVAILFLMTLCFKDSSRLWAWAGFGLLWGVSALITPVVLGVAPLLAGWSLYKIHKHGKNWKPAAATAAVVLTIVLAPWFLRNSRVFHKTMFLKDNFWEEFCVGNLGNSLHWWNGSVHPAGSNADMVEFQVLGEQAYLAEKRRLALAYLNDHWANFLGRSLRRVIFIWTGFWSLSREYLREEPLDPANIVFCTSFSLVALAGLRRAFREAPDTALPFAILLLAYPLVYYVTQPSTPYRHPLDPALVVLASYEVLSRLRSRPGKSNSQSSQTSPAHRLPDTSLQLP